MRSLSYLLLLTIGCGDPLEEFRDEESIARVARRSQRNNEPPPPPKEKKPLAVEWKVDKISSKARIKGGGAIEVSGYKGKYHITLKDVPKHSKWKVGAQTGRVDSSYTLIDLSVDDKLATHTWAELEKVDPEAELELELQDGRTGKTKLPTFSAEYMIKEALKKAENGPVLFGKEPDDPKKQDSMFWPGSYGDTPFFGKAGKLYEIDWVLIVNKLPEEKGRKVCGGYTRNGKPAPDMTLVFKDSEAVIYDRRTGEVVEKKVFGPDKACPTFTMTRAGQRTIESYSPTTAIQAWARTRVKR